MLKLPINCICFLILLNVQGRLADIQDNGTSVCVLQDAPLQCGAFCLSALHPVFDNYEKTQDKLSRIEGDQQTLNTKVLEFLQTQVEMRSQFLESQAEIRNQLLAVQTSLSALHPVFDSYEKTKDKLSRIESDQQTLHTKIPEFLQTQAEIRGQFLAVQTSLQALLTKMEDNQKPNPKNNPESVMPQKTITYIVQTKRKNWYDAASTCRGMGGHLAAIKNKAQLKALSAHLSSHKDYWISNNSEDEDEKLYINNGDLYNENGYDYEMYFICQADSEF